MGWRDHRVNWRRPERPDGMDAEMYAALPERLLMRETEIGGRVLVTTLTDAKTVSGPDMGAVYDRRWQVEVDRHSTKAEMGMDILRTPSIPMVDKKIAVYLWAYNLICAMMVRAGAGSGRKPRAFKFQGNGPALSGLCATISLCHGRLRPDDDGSSARRNQCGSTTGLT